MASVRIKDLIVEVSNTGHIFFIDKVGNVCTVNLHPTDTTELIHFLVDKCDYNFGPA